MRLFDHVADRWSYTLVVALGSTSGIWLAAAYGFFIVAGVARLHGTVLHVFGLFTVAGVVFGSLGYYVQYGLLSPLGFPGSSGVKTVNRLTHGNYPLRDTTYLTDGDLLLLLRAVGRLPLDNARTAGFYTLALTIFIALAVGAAGKSGYSALAVCGAGIVVTIIHVYFTFIASEYLTHPLLVAVKKSLCVRGVAYREEGLFSLRIKAFYLLFLIFLSMAVLTVVIVRGGSLGMISAFLAVGLLTQGLAIYVFWKTFTVSLREIGQAAVELASGGDGVFCPVSRDGEIVSFSAHYNRAAAEVNSLRTGLERKVAQRTVELKHAREKLEVNNRAPRLSNQRLQELDRMKSAILSGVSHELRTPLTCIVGFARMTGKRFSETVLPRLDLREKKVARAAGEISGNLEIMEREVRKLTALIEDILELAKMEGDGSDWRREPLRIGEIVAQAAALAALGAQAKGLRLIKDVEEGLPEVVGDRDRILRVVENLLANAVKFTDAGEVTCTARRCGEGVTVSVGDTGIGIPRQHWARVFEKFHQVGDTLTQKPAGTGLGLAVARRIVDQHGGRIWLVSEPGRGSTFSFSLPAGSGHVSGYQPKEQQVEGVIGQDGQPLVRTFPGDAHEPVH